jgi:hypothetical protein
MNKLYGDNRQFGIYSRHMSQRHPSSINNLLKRDQSSTRMSKTKANEDYVCNMFSTSFFPKKQNVRITISTNNWIKPKTR